MKIVFILGILFITTTAFTQENNKQSQSRSKHQNKYLDLLKRERNSDLKASLLDHKTLPPIISTTPEVNYSLLPNGNKVYTLTQDNMPCIVPDMSQFANRGVIKSYQYKGAGSIPNPADSINLFKN